MSSTLRYSKTRFTQGPLFCALVREEAIFAVCKRCANESFAYMCKEKYHSIHEATRAMRSLLVWNARFGVFYRNILFLYKCMQKHGLCTVYKQRKQHYGAKCFTGTQFGFCMRSWRKIRFDRRGRNGRFFDCLGQGSTHLRAHFELPSHSRCDICPF